MCIWSIIYPFSQPIIAGSFVELVIVISYNCGFICGTSYSNILLLLTFCFSFSINLVYMTWHDFILFYFLIFEFYFCNLPLRPLDCCIHRINSNKSHTHIPETQKKRNSTIELPKKEWAKKQKPTYFRLYFLLKSYLGVLWLRSNCLKFRLVKWKNY